MDESQRVAIFQAQTENVRELERAWSHINRQVNAVIISKDSKGLEVCTRMLALLYCALAEAIFSKLIHTPFCLPISEVEQIKKAASDGGVKQGWVVCAELSIKRIGGAKTNHGPNVLKCIKGLIEQYIFDPSLLRNKLAHGQWVIALNRENTAINNTITTEISSLDVVELYRRKKSLEKLSAIIEDIIESPNRAHHRDYWAHVTELDTSLKEMSSWSMQRKTSDLFAKKALAPKRA